MTSATSDFRCIRKPFCRILKDERSESLGSLQNVKSKGRLWLQRNQKAAKKAPKTAVRKAGTKAKGGRKAAAKAASRSTGT